MNSKWKKIIIGAALLIGFVLYTQYEKSAEPTWKVNAENFQVLESWDELLQMESLKYDHVKFAIKFNLLKNHNKSVPLSKDQRMLRIEKTWSFGDQLYVLYSVNLNERDKSELDVPRLTVGKIKFSTMEGEEVEVPVEYDNGQISNRGYVYEHRLYRSMLLTNNFQNLDGEYWDVVRDSVKYELMEMYMSSNGDSELMKPLAFKKPPQEMDSFPETIAASPVDQSLNLYDGTTLNIKDLEVFKMGIRLTVDKAIDDKIIAFIGDLKRNDQTYPTEYHINEENSEGSFLQNYAILDEIINMDTKDSGEFSITHSVHKTDRSHSFTVSQKDIDEIKNVNSIDIPKNTVFVNENGTEGVYKGLAIDLDSSQPVIHFTLKNKLNPIDYFMYPQPSFQFEGNPVNDRHMTNLISIKDSKGEELKNYDIISRSINEENTNFYINFYAGMPVSDLTVTVSNVIEIKPLKKQINVPLKTPDKVKK